MVMTTANGPHGEANEVRVLEVVEVRAEASLPRVRRAKRPASLPDSSGVVEDEAKQMAGTEPPQS